jgi:hypothetical protein
MEKKCRATKFKIINVCEETNVSNSEIGNFAV